jgi:pimeloyl-ACP methyl ester carboxylesterase
VAPAGTVAVLPEAAHQPFEEIPEEFNARVDAFWRDVEAGG